MSVHELHSQIPELNVPTDAPDAQTLGSQLRQARKLQELGQLAAGIAHEITTPTQYLTDNVRFLEDAFAALRRVLSAYSSARKQLRKEVRWSELIAELEAAEEAADLAYLSAEIPAALAQSAQGLERIATIVKAIREFSHPGSREIVSCDLNHAIENALTISRGEWKDVAVIHLDLDGAIPPVAGDPNELSQVILAMIVNSVHAIAEAKSADPVREGRIRISSRLLGESEIAIEIEDNGAGIPPEIIGRIYEPFFTTKAVGRGTGQGLAMARSVLVEKYRGRLEVESSVGQRTCFKIRIPLSSHG